MDHLVSISIKISFAWVTFGKQLSISYLKLVESIWLDVGDQKCFNYLIFVELSLGPLDYKSTTLNIMSQRHFLMWDMDKN